jgi:outer membrane lipopolysaccharide assembly protein LptE/RlpB
VFENETTQFGLAEALTSGVIDGLVADNQVKVEDPSTAEAVLNGRVLDYQRKAYTFDENDQVKEYLVEIWVAADLVKKDGSGSIWSAASIRGFGDYAADSSETLGQKRAIKKIAEDIINRTVKSW